MINKCIFHTNVCNVIQQQMIPKCSNLVWGMTLWYPTNDRVSQVRFKATARECGFELYECILVLIMNILSHSGNIYSGDGEGQMSQRDEKFLSFFLLCRWQSFHLLWNYSMHIREDIMACIVVSYHWILLLLVWIALPAHCFEADYTFGHLWNYRCNWLCLLLCAVILFRQWLIFTKV